MTDLFNNQQQKKNFIQLDTEDKVIFYVCPEKRTSQGILKIKSLSSKYVAFKIKTTKPDDYSVSPSNGILAPLSEVSIKLKAEEITWARSSGKFLLQAFETNQVEKINWKAQSQNFLQQIKLFPTFEIIRSTKSGLQKSPNIAIKENSLQRSQKVLQSQATQNNKRSVILDEFDFIQKTDSSVQQSHIFYSVAKTKQKEQIILKEIMILKKICIKKTDCYKRILDNQNNRLYYQLIERFLQNNWNLRFKINQEDLKQMKRLRNIYLL